MNPALKRFWKEYGPVADTLASADIDQVERERMAEELADKFDGRPGFKRDLFVLVASDPLVLCAGAGGEPCPEGHRIRIAMHWRGAPDGRSKAWEPQAPVVRCVSCGAREFGLVKA